MLSYLAAPIRSSSQSLAELPDQTPRWRDRPTIQRSLLDVRRYLLPLQTSDTCMCVCNMCVYICIYIYIYIYIHTHQIWLSVDLLPTHHFSEARSSLRFASPVRSSEPCPGGCRKRRAHRSKQKPHVCEMLRDMHHSWSQSCCRGILLVVRNLPRGLAHGTYGGLVWPKFILFGCL